MGDSESGIGGMVDGIIIIVENVKITPSSKNKRKPFVPGWWFGTWLAAALLLPVSGFAARQTTKPSQVFMTMLLALGFHLSPQRAAVVYREIQHGPEDLAHEEALLRKDGVPVTAREIRAKLSVVSEQDNAASLWLQLGRPLQALQHSPNPDLQLLLNPVQLGAATPVRRQAAWKQLASQQHLVNRVVEASQKPHARFPILWENLISASLGHNATMRNGALLLSAQSIFLAEKGQYIEAIRLQSKGFHIAEQTMEDPDFLISYLAASRIDSITLSGLQEILMLVGQDRNNSVLAAPRVPASAGDWGYGGQRQAPVHLRRTVPGGSQASVARAVRLAITDSRPRLNLERALWGEAVLDTQAIQMVTSNPQNLGRLSGTSATSQPFQFRLPGEKQFLSDTMAASGARQLHLLHLLVKEARQPTYLARVRFARAHGIDQPGIDHLFQNQDPVNILPAILFPVLSSWRNEANTRSSEQITLAAAALLEYRARYGHFPDRLGMAAPHTYDPFSGKALQYRRMGDGFVVFSVGEHQSFEPDNLRSDLKRNRELFFRYP